MRKLLRIWTVHIGREPRFGTIEDRNKLKELDITIVQIGLPDESVGYGDQFQGIWVGGQYQKHNLPNVIPPSRLFRVGNEPAPLSSVITNEEGKMEHGIS